ncbi:GT2 family glycosyltransferase [Rhizobium mesoamericanum]|uniref:glycosyltransferase n=1 Tax=Rhizobium mesoamericanum TaxID=1079800 RepID=UPI00277F4528|nr:glycosyltransferase family 2 protein [Rhizobium mesoamericanum]MDQ0559940.1 GT2 family glycosyltransferase [Rhizobium mesoamericanum]
MVEAQKERRRASDAKNAPSGLSIIIVTFNSAVALPQLLDSLPGGLKGVDHFGVVIVDNDSQDGSADLAEAHPISPTVIRMGRNAGYAAAINAAARTVDPDQHLLILNPDLRLYPGAVGPLMEEAATPSTGVVVPMNHTEDGKIDLTLRREPSILTAWADALLGGSLAAWMGLGEVISAYDRYRRRGPVEWATGSALLVSARARQIVGRWDESFFLYSEEVDYLRRVRDAGFDVIYEPLSQVMHTKGGSGRSARLFALMTANRIRYYQRRHGVLPTAIFRLAIVLGQVIRCWRGPWHRAALFGALRPLGSVSDFGTGSRA